MWDKCDGDPLGNFVPCLSDVFCCRSMLLLLLLLLSSQNARKNLSASRVILDLREYFDNMICIIQLTKLNCNYFCITCS